MTAEHSMRCVAQTGWGARCRRFGDIRVTATGGRVCRQHHRFGWTPHRLPDDVEVDPRIAARAAAVLGADHARPRGRASEPEEEEVEREPGPTAEAFADLGRDLGARLAADRALLRRRLNHGALHRCDNPPCVRPDHLFSGTAKDNAADRGRKGRTARGKRRPETVVRGERQRRAKLTDEAVREIRARFDRGETRQELAREFGVSWTVVDGVVKRTLWSHVA